MPCGRQTASFHAPQKGRSPNSYISSDIGFLTVSPQTHCFAVDIKRRENQSIRCVLFELLGPETAKPADLSANTRDIGNGIRYHLGNPRENSKVSSTRGFKIVQIDTHTEGHIDKNPTSLNRKIPNFRILRIQRCWTRYCTNGGRIHTFFLVF